jgi:hypothetical protein
MHAVSRRKSSVVGLVAAAGLVVPGLAAAPAAAVTDPSISINNPALAGTPVAGTVVLSGNVSTGTSMMSRGVCSASCGAVARVHDVRRPATASSASARAMVRPV